MHTARSLHVNLSDEMRVAPKVVVVLIKVNNEVCGDMQHVFNL